MYKKLILALGAIAVICSLAMPVMRAELAPSNDGSIIFTWNSGQKDVLTADVPATVSRTLAIASGAILLAFVLPDKKRD